MLDTNNFYHLTNYFKASCSWKYECLQVEADWQIDRIFIQVSCLDKILFLLRCRISLQEVGSFMVLNKLSSLLMEVCLETKNTE